LSWKANEGFYYSSYDKTKGSELSAKPTNINCISTRNGKKDDKVIFGADQKRRYVGGGVTEDDRYLITGKFYLRKRVVHQRFNKPTVLL
jgi:prolyl oligopeptidase